MVSGLSRGAKNKNHKAYKRNEKRINAVLCKGISRRRTDMRVSEVYTDAGIAPPTFYSHHRSVQAAKINYEMSLELDLKKRMPHNPKREIIYMLLTTHIARNRKYFTATAKGCDYYLLNKILCTYRVNLVGDKLDDRAFRYYVGTVIVAINCWLKFDGVTDETTEECYRQLLRIRPMRW